MQHSISNSFLVRLREVAQYPLQVDTVLSRSLKEVDVQVEETGSVPGQPPLTISPMTINLIECCTNGLEYVPANHISSEWRGGVVQPYKAMAQRKFVRLYHTKNPQSPLKWRNRTT